MNQSLAEITQEYDRLSQEEKFKGRFIIQQLSQLMYSMEENLLQTHFSFLQTKVHENCILNDYDACK